MNDIVIRFYDVLRMMVENPGAKRQIAWKLRFFEKEVDSIEEGSLLRIYADAMLHELTLCNRRKRSRRHMYNAALIDSVWGSYMISRSPKSLENAWSNFCTSAYKCA